MKSWSCSQDGARTTTRSVWNVGRAAPLLKQVRSVVEEFDGAVLASSRSDGGGVYFERRPPRDRTHGAPGRVSEHVEHPLPRGQVRGALHCEASPVRGPLPLIDCNRGFLRRGVL